jgi:tetratricopeptide (TPR) repeat protein
LNELQVFQKLIFAEIKLESAQKPDDSLAYEKKTEIIEKYKRLLEEAEEQLDSNPEKAVELFTEAIELKPEFSTLVKRGDAYYLMNEFMFAIKDYR